MEGKRLRRAIAGLFLIAIGLFLAVSVVSYDPGDRPVPDSPPNLEEVKNLCGTAGAAVGFYALVVFGWASVPAAVGLTVAGVLLLTGVRVRKLGLVVPGLAAAFVALTIGLSLHLATAPGGEVFHWRVGEPSGGAVGKLLTEWLYGCVGWVGAVTVFLLLSSISLLMVAGSPVTRAAHGAKALFMRSMAGLRRLPGRLRARRPIRAARASRDAPAGEATPAAPVVQDLSGDQSIEEPWQTAPGDPFDVTVPDEPQEAGAEPAEEPPIPEEAPEPDEAVFEQEIPDEPEVVSRVTPGPEAPGDAMQGYLWGEGADAHAEAQHYELPTLDILDVPDDEGISDDAEEYRQKSHVLERTLREFKIEARVVRIQRGPVITMYELALAAGTKVSRVESLSNDLAIALKAPNVRIVAPLPGKSTVGIELPNDEREMVLMRELLGGADRNVARMAIPLMMGKDTAGTPLVIDLAKCPHLLIAGATGSGKSVAINSIICSILMMRTPHEVQLLLVDPKSVEFSDYINLPHLICPILTDMKKAAAVLQWACKKMDERYSLLSATATRNLASYNKLGREEIIKRLNPEEDASVDDVPFYMPHIVIIIDELGELMMVAAKEVESSIIRLSQKARAVGIHLLCATQRPSVDVITGLIKANLPVRVGFQVSSKVDSRTILDRNGAELLLGRGDMLVIPPGASRLVRAQGTYVSNQEAGRIVDFWREQGPPQYRTELREYQAAAAGDEPSDDLYEDAVRVVLETQRGSVSLLQRRLSIGYSRAARLVDLMAETGIVGSYKGSKAREVMMTIDEWETARDGKS